MQAQAPLSIPLASIVVGENVRNELGDLTELETSVRRHGVLIPIGVSPVEGGWRIQYGFRRYTAACRVGLTEIPAVVVPEGIDALLVNILENEHRKDLSPIEQAEGYQQLSLRLNGSLDEVADLVGHSVPHVCGRLSLLNAADQVRDAVRTGTIGVGAGVELARLPAEQQAAWVNRAKRVSLKALKEDVDFQLMSPEEREQLGAAELARLAGREEQTTLPNVREDVNDPRLLMGPEYARRVMDHVEALVALWPDLPTVMQTEILNTLSAASQLITTLEVAQVVREEA